MLFEIVAVLVAIVIAAILINRNTIRREAERAEEYSKAAALRGWQLEFNGIEYRYSGTTESVPWVIRVGHYRRRHNRNVRPMRWETTSVKMNDGALIVWPDFGQGVEAIGTPGVPDFVLALALRPVAHALGASASDAATLARATAITTGPRGFLFRGTDGPRLEAWLANGAADALAGEEEWLGRQGHPNHLIVAIVWRYGLQIATAYGSNDFEQMERVVRVGVKLAKAAS